MQEGDFLELYQEKESLQNAVMKAYFDSLVIVAFGFISSISSFSLSPDSFHLKKTYIHSFTKATSSSSTMRGSMMNNEVQLQETYSETDKGKYDVYIFSCSMPKGVSVERAYDTWINFGWRQGGGLWFVPTPRILVEGDVSTGEGMERMILPVCLREKILEGKRPHSHGDAGNFQNNNGRIIYKVMNPSVMTFYPVIDHEGEIVVSIPDNNSLCNLLWTVRVIPMTGFKWFVRSMTTFIIKRYILNIRQKLK